MHARASSRRQLRSAPAWLVLLALGALVLPSATLAQPRARVAAPDPPISTDNGCGLGDTSGVEPSGSSMISGRVTNAAAAGIADIRVRARTTTPPFLTAETTTSATGDYLFAALTGDDYVVSFYDETGMYRSGFWSTGGLAIGRSAATPIDAGTNLTGRNLVLPVEPDPLPIISGTILDNTGQPVEGVEVRADLPDFPLAGCGFTDASGVYAMPDVRVGQYVVSVASESQPDGYYAAAPPSDFVTRRSGATLVTVTANVPGIDIRFPATFSLDGAITDAGAVGVEGISLSACEAVDGGLCSFTSSGGGGAFSLPALTAGSYVIRQVDSTMTYTSGFSVPGGVVADRSAAAVISVTTDVIGVALSAVLNPRIIGIVTDPDGVPLDGIELDVCPSTGDEECVQGTTSGGGAYAIGVNPGTYILQMSDPTGENPTGYIGPAGLEVAQPDDARTVTVGATDEPIGPVAFADGGRIGGTTVTGGSPAAVISYAICRGSESDCVAGGESDDNGIFASRAVLPDDYLIAAFTEAGTFWYVFGGPAAADPGLATTITVGTTDVTGIVFDVPASTTGEPTPEGDDVEVTPADPSTGSAPVTLTFDHVSGAGETTLAVSDSGPEAPAGFQLGVPPTWFDIDTSASFDGLVTICISYADISFIDESSLRLFHYDTTTDTWHDTTVSQDTVTDVVCGRTDSFSPFAIFTRAMGFTGFKAPIVGPPAVNLAKAGATVPLGFGLGGDFGLSVLAAGSPASQRTDCTTGAPIGAAEATTSANKKDVLRYDRKKQLYSYDWKTVKTWDGTCRQLILTFSDGSTAEAAFDFRPAPKPEKPPKPPKPPKGH